MGRDARLNQNSVLRKLFRKYTPKPLTSAARHDAVIDRLMKLSTRPSKGL